MLHLAKICVLGFAWFCVACHADDTSLVQSRISADSSASTCEDEMDDCADGMSGCATIGWVQAVCKRSCGLCGSLLKEHRRSQRHKLTSHKHARHAVMKDEPPSLIIQAGAQRTATSLQHRMLCVAMFLKRPGSEGDCSFMDLKRDDDLSLHGSNFYVLKTHSLGTIKHILGQVPSDFGEVWMFTTGLKQAVNIADGSNLLSLKLETPVKDLGEKGTVSIVNEIANIFKLNTEQTTAFHDYFRWWPVLRQCCGSQMSADWRHVLQHGSPPTNPHHPVASAAYPACEVYNIDQVEKALMETEVWQKFHEKSSMIGTVSSLDCPLDGNYCQRAAELTRKEKHIRFNTDFHGKAC